MVEKRLCHICYENIKEDNSVCPSCGTPIDSEKKEDSKQREIDELVNHKMKTDETKQLYIIHNECKNEMPIENENQTSFYCEECEVTVKIDGIVHRIQAHLITPPELKNLYTDELILKERVTKHQFIITQEGGILGRYGDFEPEIFQTNNWLYVAGEHLLINYEKGDWYIEHIGSNPTFLDRMKLEKGMKFIIRDGQILKLANITFEIMIGRKNAD